MLHSHHLRAGSVVMSSHHKNHIIQLPAQVLGTFPWGEVRSMGELVLKGYGCLHTIYGSGSKPKACNKAGAHTRDIPHYKGYVTGARLARQALQFHEYS